MGKTNEQELNLLQIFGKIGEWLKNILSNITHMVSYSIKMSVKYWYLFLVVFSLSILASLYLSRPSNHKYHAETVLHASFSDISYVNEVIDQLRPSIKDNDLYSFASKLQIPNNIAKNIIKIQRYDIIDYLDDNTPNMIDFKRSHSPRDTTNLVMNDRVYLRLVTLDPNNLDVIYDAVMNYLNTNSRLVNEYEFNKQILTTNIALIDKETNRIDSLAQTNYFKNEDRIDLKMSSDRMILGERKKPLFYDDLIYLMSQKYNREKQYEMAVQPVYSTTGFIVSGPINGRLKLLVFGFIIGVISGLVVSSLYAKRKLIKDFLTSEK